MAHSGRMVLAGGALTGAHQHKQQGDLRSRRLGQRPAAQDQRQAAGAEEWQAAAWWRLLHTTQAQPRKLSPSLVRAVAGAHREAAQQGPCCSEGPPLPPCSLTRLCPSPCPRPAALPHHRSMPGGRRRSSTLSCGHMATLQGAQRNSRGSSVGGARGSGSSSSVASGRCAVAVWCAQQRQQAFEHGSVPAL